MNLLLEQTNYTSRRCGVPTGTDFNLWFAVCKHTRYNRMTPCEHRVIDVFTRGVSLWDTNYTSCRRVVPSGTDFNLWFAICKHTRNHMTPCEHRGIDVFTRRVSLWDTNYTSCRRGVPSGTDFNLWFAVRKHTRYNCMTPCEHWLIDWRVYTWSLPLRHNYTSCRRGVPGGTEATLLASVPT